MLLPAAACCSTLSSWGPAHAAMSMDSRPGHFVRKLAEYSVLLQGSRRNHEHIYAILLLISRRTTFTGEWLASFRMLMLFCVSCAHYVLGVGSCAWCANLEYRTPRSQPACVQTVGAAALFDNDIQNIKQTTTALSRSLQN